MTTTATKRCYEKVGGYYLLLPTHFALRLESISCTNRILFSGMKCDNTIMRFALAEAAVRCNPSEKNYLFTAHLSN